MARFGLLVLLAGCVDPIWRESCPTASETPLEGDDRSAYAGLTPAELLSRLEGTRTGTMVTVDQRAPVPVALPVSVTRRFVSVDGFDDVAAEAPTYALSSCPTGDHLRLTGVRFALDVVPLDGSAPFSFEIEDVEVRAYGSADDELELFPGDTNAENPVSLPPSLQAAAIADACGDRPVGRAGLYSRIEDPAPLFGLSLDLHAEQLDGSFSCGGGFLEFVPDP